MPATPDESQHQAIDDLAEKLNLPVTEESDFLAVHRLPVKKAEGSPLVLIRFSSVRLRERWLGARAGLRFLIYSLVCFLTKT